jgi:uncharacterized protein
MKDRYMTLTNFTPFASAIGGAMIGASALILMLFSGRIAGITGIVRRLLPPFDQPRATLEAAAFIAGLIAAPLIWRLLSGSAAEQTVSGNLPLLTLAGVLTGFGAAWGSGCTSGHGVCGLSRFSLRSLAATGTFMAAGIVTVYIARHVLGG